MSKVVAGYKQLSGTCVLKVKSNINGNITWFKVRWRVWAYLQQFGVDFIQTYAAIRKSIAFRVLFAVAAYYHFNINQIGIKIAFLYNFIDQFVYVQVLMSCKSQAIKRMVCKLLKIFYSLKQVPRVWYKRLLKFFLNKVGLPQIIANHNIFISSAKMKWPVVSTFIAKIKIWESKI